MNEQLFDDLVRSTGEGYVSARQRFLADRMAARQVLNVNRQSAEREIDRVLADILESRLSNKYEFERLEQEFRSKTFLFYWQRPQTGIVQRPLIRTLEGLLVPGEKSPYDLDPEHDLRAWGDNADKVMPPYFESVRVSESPLWGLFCCEIALKGWVPAGGGGIRSEVASASPTTVQNPNMAAPAKKQVEYERDRLDQIDCQAISLLGKLQEHRAGPVLHKVLEDNSASPSKRGAAALAIGRLHYKESLPLLIERCQMTVDLERPDEVSQVLLERDGVFRAIVMLKDRSGIPALQKIVDGNVAWAQQRRDDAIKTKRKRVPPAERREVTERSRHTEAARRTIAELMKTE